MEHKNFFKRQTMPISELEVYYREQRKAKFEKNEPFKGIKLRKLFHPILISGLKVMHLVSGQKITVVGDRRVPTNRPIIFAASHIGWDDVEMIFTAIGKHAYVLWGDPHELYRQIDGFFLNMNGSIIIDTGDKSDRHIAKETCVNWLNQGGNLLIFPEGVWNTSENKLIQYIFPGVAEMAIRTGADIIPVAIMQYGKEFRINFGKNISQGKWSLDEKQMLTNELRDIMNGFLFRKG